MSSSELPEYAVRNRASWTKSNEDYTHEQGVRAWKQDDITWGVFSVPESELNALPDVAGQGRDRARLRHRVLLRVARPARCASGRRRRRHRRSSRPRGRCSARPGSSSRSSRRTPRRSRSRTRRSTSSSPSTARRSGATRTSGSPRRPACFDQRASSSSCATRRSPMLCANLEGTSETLQRPQRGLHRLDWEDDGTTEFQLGHGDLFKLLRENGFDVLDLIEIFAPEDAENHAYYHSQRGVGEASGRGKRSGGRASAHERSARAAAAARVDVAATSQRSSSSSAFPSRSSPPTTRSTTRPRPTRSSSSRSTRSGRRARSPTAPTGGRCSASTPPSFSAGAAVRQAGERRGGGGDARRAQREDASRRLRARAADAGLGAGRPRRDARHVSAR